MIGHRQNALKGFINGNTTSTAIKEAPANAEKTASSKITTANAKYAKSSAEHANESLTKIPEDTQPSKNRNNFKHQSQPLP
jgi:hypothetical protein